MVINFLHIKNSTQQQKYNSVAGFTLIELVVIISIFAIMSTILLGNFTGFNKNIQRNNLAQDIGLIVRKAQSYGATSSTLPGSLLDTNTVPLRYGLLFDYNSSSQTIESMVLYKKISNNSSSVGFNNGTSIQIPGSSTSSDVIVLDTITVASPGVSIAICTPPSSNNYTCGTPLTSDVAIEFERPKPDPYTSLPSPYNSSLIVRMLPDDGSVPWYIIVTQTGNIYVKRS